MINDVTAFGYAVAAFLNHLYEMIDSDLRTDRRTGDASRTIATALTHPLDISTLEAVLEMVKAAASSRQSLERRDGSDR